MPHGIKLPIHPLRARKGTVLVRNDARTGASLESPRHNRHHNKLFCRTRICRWYAPAQRNETRSSNALPDLASSQHGIHESTAAWAICTMLSRMYPHSLLGRLCFLRSVVVAGVLLFFFDSLRQAPFSCCQAPFCDLQCVFNGKECHLELMDLFFILCDLILHASLAPRDVVRRAFAIAAPHCSGSKAEISWQTRHFEPQLLPIVRPLRVRI